MNEALTKILTPDLEPDFMKETLRHVFENLKLAVRFINSLLFS